MSLFTAQFAQLVLIFLFISSSGQPTHVPRTQGGSSDSGGHSASDSRDDDYKHKKRDDRIQRPAGGTGTILISYDNSTRNCNKERILIVFDLVCVGKIDESDEELMAKIDSIQSTYRECMELYNLSTSGSSHYDTANYSYVWMDLKCTISTIQSLSNLSIDWDALCVEYIMYEPLYWQIPLQSLTSNDTTNSTAIIPSNDDNDTMNAKYCISESLGSPEITYGLDLLDSPWLDGEYTFPNLSALNHSDDDYVDNEVVALYILDSGVQAQHLEFAENQVIHRKGSGPANVSTNSGEGVEYDSHGTHVAGIAGGETVGASRGLTIYDYRVCLYNENGEVPCYTTMIIDALDEIIRALNEKPGTRAVINLSLGGAKTGLIDLYQTYFNRIIANGGIPVVAAGNENVDACDMSPAYATNAITVGAFKWVDANRERKKSWYSNWGSCVDLWAPGDNIYSSLASTSDDSYGLLTGSSMATPLISGVVANLLMVQPTLGFDDIMDALLNTSATVTSDWCDDNECLAPIYSCGLQRFGEEIPFDSNSGLSRAELSMIILGCILVAAVITGICGYWYYQKQDDMEHEMIPSGEDYAVEHDEDMERNIIMYTDQYDETEHIFHTADTRDFGTNLEDRDGE